MYSINFKTRTYGERYNRISTTRNNIYLEQYVTLARIVVSLHRIMYIIIVASYYNTTGSDL